MTRKAEKDRTYLTQFQCEVCGEYFEVEFEDPDKKFEGTCLNCGTHYPELFV